MIKELENKLKFIELVEEMKIIKRAAFKKNWNQETDAEHSYHLAVMVMIFIHDFQNLNYEKSLKLALIHDFLEIYAWDTIVFDKKLEDTKIQRERQALIRLKKEYWNVLPEFIELLEEYENKISLESKFVYSLDKVQPVIQNVIAWWKARNFFKTDFDEIKQRQYSKIFPEFEFLKQILDIYFEKAEKEKIFYKK